MESTSLTTEQLFARSVATLVQSWVYLAAGSPGAEVIESGGAAIAVFVHSPDREFLNNTVLPGGVEGAGEIIDAAERCVSEPRGRALRDLGARVRSGDRARGASARGYAHDSSTRTMAMEIADLAEVDTTELDLVEPTPTEFWRVDGLDGLVPELSPRELTSTSPASTVRTRRC